MPCIRPCQVLDGNGNVTRNSRDTDIKINWSQLILGTTMIITTMEQTAATSAPSGMYSGHFDYLSLSMDLSSVDQI